ncbi:MAG: permease-like cell division protein FtsX [Oscillospiraceae bacterium]|nr:permease-like cell division protein FtsX [Bacteroidales bacterium]MDD6998667.1 permease-like cell division protein FtsX [Oscillospiraceae bacterium]MDY5095560.1 permease-like cell division protein FtsX [Oscillospiraceae bacterium]
MKWSSFQYLTKQGLHNLRANRLMSLASIGVLTACLLLTGIAGLFSANVNSLVEYLGDQNETVVYLDQGLSDEELASVDQTLRSMPGLAAVTYVSQEEVLETYKGYMSEYADLFNDFEEDNPFHANYRVVLENLNQLDEMIAQLEQIDGVYSVSAPTQLSSVFLTIQRAVTYAGWALVAVLALVSVVVISNTIRLTVFARRKEINIMKYVGATNGFIRWPFFVEGTSVGLISGLLAAGLVIGAYALVVNRVGAMSGFWGPILGSCLLSVGQVWPAVLGAFLIFGVVIGSIGTATSIRKYLEV